MLHGDLVFDVSHSLDNLNYMHTTRFHFNVYYYYYTFYVHVVTIEFVHFTGHFKLACT